MKQKQSKTALKAQDAKRVKEDIGEESERMKAFRKRKEKELRRRRRNKFITRMILFLAFIGMLSWFAVKVIKPRIPGFGMDPVNVTEEEISTEAIETELSTEEATTEEWTTAEITTEEPETEPPDPREDVWNHYSNMFIVKQTDSYLNVRDQPTQNGNIKGRLMKYSGGELLENLGNGWYHISSGGIDGYIAGEYCVTGEEALQIALEHCFEMVEISAERLNVRSGPGEEYEAWTQLAAMERQMFEAEEGDWYKIRIDSTYGYINKEFAKRGFFLKEAMPWSSVSKYSETRQALFAYAEQFLGTPYVYGGTSLTGGIDCSSYVQQCFRNALGIQLPRTSREQVNCGVEVSLAEAKAGDLLFYADASGIIEHVAIYMGDGKIMHAALSFGQVTTSTYNYSTEPVHIRNVIGD